MRVLCLNGLIFLLLLNLGCAPGIPRAAAPTARLPSTESLREMTPVGVAIASAAAIQADSRGWQYWQSKVQTASDAVWWPARIAANTYLAPLAIPLSSYSAAETKNYLQKVSSEMDLLEKLHAAVLKEIHSKQWPIGAFSTDNSGRCLPVLQSAQADGCPPAIRTILVLEAAKVYLDKSSMYKKGSDLPDFNLIISSRWVLKSLTGDFDPIHFEEVTDRPFIGDRFETPYELILALDEHSKGIIERFQQPSSDIGKIE